MELCGFGGGGMFGAREELGLIAFSVFGCRNGTVPGL